MAKRSEQQKENTPLGLKANFVRREKTVTGIITIYYTLIGRIIANN
jgi:hypothetical protein